MPVIVPDPDCGKGWIASRNHCYQLVMTDRSWAEARRDCIYMDAQLASVTSPEEQHAMESEFYAAVKPS